MVGCGMGISGSFETMDNRATRETLLALYRIAVAAAHPAVCLPQHLPALPANGRLIVLGAGKANAAMAVAAEAHYLAQAAGERVAGFVTTRHGFALPTRRIEIIEAGHPVPDPSSLDGAARAITVAQAATAEDLILVLMSGGASALWCQPVNGVSIAAKQAITRELLKAGTPIGEINIVRKHLSRIKGGKLAALAYPARVVTLAISDIPGDAPSSIGSGPTVADPSTLTDARAVLQRWHITPSPDVAAALADPANETVKPGAAALAGTRCQIIAAPKASLEAAADAARARGYAVEILGDALEGEARDVARSHADIARTARALGQRKAILSGGEFTVTVRGTGAGGPNQEYALGLAMALRGTPGICALSADTDGIDGGSGTATDPAGAYVFDTTLARAAAANLDPAAYLANNDSTGFFAGLGDLVEVGPTQTNVNDFRVILVDPTE